MPTSTRLPTLLAEAEQRAHDEHSRRLAELKALSLLLYQLDDLRPQLETLGLKVCVDRIFLAWYRPEGNIDAPRRKVLRLHTTGVLDRDVTAGRWFQALLALGMREISRNPCPHFPTALLKRGHLLMQVDVPRAQAAQQPQEQQAA